MKRLFCFATALLLLGAAVAADKVVDSSARRAPKWIGGMEEDYIIVSAEAGTLADAQQKAMTSVREQIISAVATHVESATSITLYEVSENGDIQSRHEMKSRLNVEAADIPYLSEVSPSRATEYYWMKIRKSDKSTYYSYHVKYPFTRSQLRLLSDEYNARQKAINDTIQAFASADFSTYTSLDQMLMQHSRLKQFAATLREDDQRRDICAAIRRTYGQMMTQNLHVEVLSSDRTQTVAALFYGSTQLLHSMVPKTKTNCLTAIETKMNGNTAVIRYDYSTGCYEGEQNWLDIQYTVIGKKISTRCYIP